MFWYWLIGILLVAVSALVLYANRGLARIYRRDGGLEHELRGAFLATAIAWPITGLSGIAFIFQPLLESWVTAGIGTPV